MPTPSTASPPAVPPELPGIRLTGVLGTGGFGAVFGGVREADSVPVAVKVAHIDNPIVVAQFRSEAAALERIGAPTVPALYQLGALPDRRPFIVMERLEGHLLAAELEEARGPLPRARIRELADALLTSVAALHEKGVVHRDLKPENIFLCGTPPQARIMDLGITQEMDGAESTEPGTAAGTPEYMAPEQIKGTPPFQAPTDVYALGLILYELLTLHLPFTGEAAQVQQAHLSLRPPKPSARADVSSAVDAVVLKALAKTPKRRYASVAELRTAFLEALDAGGAAAKQPGAAAPATSKSKASAGASQQRVVMLFMTGVTEVVEVRSVMEGAGGVLAYMARDQCVGVLGHRAGDHPVQRALTLAQRILSRSAADRVLVDVGMVRAKERAGGAVTYLSPTFSDASRYPSADDPKGVMVTGAARGSLTSTPDHTLTGEGDRSLLTSSGQTLGGATIAAGTLEPLLGRTEALETLKQAADGAAKGSSPALSTVIGAPGVGKSHLAAAFAETLRRRGERRVWELRGREPMAGEADQTLVQLLCLALGVQPGSNPEGLRQLSERLGPEIAAEVYAGVALILGWIDPDHPEVKNVRAAPGALRSSVARALGEGLRAAARVGPAFVTLDDAQWLDEATLDGIEYATAQGNPARLWVGVYARPGFEQARPGWGQRAAGGGRIALEPLDPASAAELCRRLLRPAEHVPESIVSRLLERTGGSPQLIVSLLTGLKRDGLLRSRAAGSDWYLATELLERLPDLALVDWIATREVEALPESLVACAQVASLMATHFAVEELEGVVETLDQEGGGLQISVDPGVALGRLQSAGILQAHRDQSISFKNPLVRDQIAAAVPEAARAAVHRAALAHYRSSSSSLSGSVRLGRVAWHAALAGARAEAATAYLQLAEEARGRHAFLEAEILYTKALAQLEEDAIASRLVALKGRGNMRYRVARYDDSIGDLRAARELAQKLGEQETEADTLLDAAMALDWLEEYRQSKQLVDEAAPLVGPSSPLKLQARLSAARGFSDVRFSKYEESIVKMFEALHLAERLGDDGYEITVTTCGLLGFVLPFQGRVKEAQDVLDRSLALCHEKHDPLHLFGMYNNRSCLWIALDDKARALEDMAQAEQCARTLGISNAERNVALNRAIYLYWRGELEAAEPHAHRVIELDQRRMRDAVRPDGTVVLARIRWAGGDHTGAAALVGKVQAHQEEMRRIDKKDALLFPNDAVLLHALQLALDRAPPAAWEPVLARAEHDAQGQELIEILEIRGLAALQAGDPTNARAAWAKALEVGKRLPNALGGRIARRLASLDA